GGRGCSVADRHARRARRSGVRGRRGDRRSRSSRRGRQRPRRGRRVRRCARSRSAAGTHARRGDKPRERGRRARRSPARVLGGDAVPPGSRGRTRMTEFLLRAGSWEQVTPESAGWNYLDFGVRQGTFESATGPVEIAVVPLGGRCRVEAGGQSWELGGRDSVFDGMPSALYLPRDTSYRVEGEAEVAICGALCAERREPVLIKPEDVEIEVRGAGTVRDVGRRLGPFGYHTTAAAHGEDVYYLNALAGDRRSMAAADDPELAWIRAAWSQLEPDPRVPLVK